MSEQWLSTIGFTLVFAGFAIALIAIVMMLVKGTKDGNSKGKVKGGGVVIIGPIPIIFGTDRESVKIILALSLILMILALVWMMVNYKIL